MDGNHGLTENSAFYGLIICNTAVVVFSPTISPLIRLLGTRTSVLISVLLCGSIDFVLFYPTDYLVYTAFLLNGLGCALLRVAALAFMTQNSSRETLTRNNSIHWAMFTAGPMLGNGVVMLINIRSKEIDEEKRCAIATATSIMCLLAIPGFFFTKNISGEENPILSTAKQRKENNGLNGRTSPLSHAYSSIDSELSNGTTEAKDKEEDLLITKGNAEQCNEGRTEDRAEKSSLRKVTGAALFTWETLLLLPSMLEAGVYCTAYSPIVPVAVGAAVRRAWIVSGFGISVGVGQLCGAFVTGGLIERVGIRIIAIATNSLAVITFGLVWFVVQAAARPQWHEWISYFEALILVQGLFVGVCNMSNNVCLTVAIGRTFKENPDPAFSLFITVMSISMILFYVVQTVTQSSLSIILILYSVVSVTTALSFSFLKIQ